MLGDPGLGTAPYVEDERSTTSLAGLNLELGPSIGAGVDIPLNRSLSLLIESGFLPGASSPPMYAVRNTGMTSGVTGSGLLALGQTSSGSDTGTGSDTDPIDSSQNGTSGMTFDSALNPYSWAALGLATLLLGAVPSTAQSGDINAPFFAKIGMGASDYTGDLPIQNRGYPFDLQEFKRGNGIPFTNFSELGYRLSSAFAVAAGLQVGNYPIAGYNSGNLKETNLYTVQLLGRYTFGDSGQSIRPYVDAGLNATFGGVRTGYGPSVGGGVDIPLNHSLSLFVESRFNLTLLDDAIDGVSNIGDRPGSTTSKTDDPKGSITGPFDSANQLLGVGIKVDFGGPSQTPNDVSSETSDPAPTSSDEGPSDEEAERASPTSSPDTSRQEDAVQVPSGTFIMGLTDEDPLSIQSAGRKRVTISPFYIERREVTNAEYRDYLSQLSSDERGERLPDSTAWTKARTEESWEVYFRSDYYSDYPVIGVTWDEARAYCRAHDKRLPTEAEWEYAARAGHLGRVYPWNGLTTRGQNGDYLANFKPPEGYAADGYAFTAPVGAFPPNNWGLYEMAGNVAEWTRDAYTPSYDNLSDFNPYYQDEEESRRVVRGGAWNSDSFFIGVGVRDTQPRDEASIEVGFRCASEAASLDSEDTPEDTAESGNVPE